MIEKNIEPAMLEEEAEKLSTTSGKPISNNYVNEGGSTNELKSTEWNKNYHILYEVDHLPLYRDIRVNAELPRKKAWQKNSSGIKLDRYEDDYPHLHRANKPPEVRYVTHQKTPINEGHFDEKESLILFAETIGTSIRKGFEMPKCDCLMFDGNPMNYPRFIENFKTNHEEREQSPRVRLAYLIQFCTGIAKEATSNCVMLSEDEGHSKAREILDNSFAQNHMCLYQ